MLMLSWIPQTTQAAANAYSFPLQLLHCFNWSDTVFGNLFRVLLFNQSLNFQAKEFRQSKHLIVSLFQHVRRVGLALPGQWKEGKAKEITVRSGFFQSLFQELS